MPAVTPSSRSYLNQRRPAKAPLAQAPPTVRDVAGWLTRHPASLTEDDRPRLKAVLDRCPELQTASGQVRSFAIMIAQLAGQDPRSGSAAPAPLTCRACEHVLPAIPGILRTSSRVNKLPLDPLVKLTADESQD
jgi:hypothetical protein